MGANPKGKGGAGSGGGIGVVLGLLSSEEERELSRIREARTAL